MFRTYSIRRTSSSTRDSLKQRKTEDARKAFACTVGKGDTLSITAIRRRITIASLKEELIEGEHVLERHTQESI
jgi:hypothetical protein